MSNFFNKIKKTKKFEARLVTSLRVRKILVTLLLVNYVSTRY